MRGQRALIALRLQGKKPASVFAHVLDTEPRYSQFTDPEMLFSGELPDLEILLADEIGTLDLRCLAALRVIVSGTNQHRVGDFCRRATQFEPAELLICLPDCLVTWRAGQYEKFPVSTCQTSGQPPHAEEVCAPEYLQELNTGPADNEKGLAYTNLYPTIDSMPKAPNFQQSQIMETT